MEIISKIICNFVQNWFVSVAIGTNKIRSKHGDFTQFLWRLASFCCLGVMKKKKSFSFAVAARMRTSRNKPEFIFPFELNNDSKRYISIAYSLRFGKCSNIFSRLSIRSKNTFFPKEIVNFLAIFGSILVQSTCNRCCGKKNEEKKLFIYERNQNWKYCVLTPMSVHIKHQAIETWSIVNVTPYLLFICLIVQNFRGWTN